MSHIFLSAWSVLPCAAHSTPPLLGHACRKGHVPSDIETRVLSTPWKITLKQHVLRLLSLNLCVVVSGLHLLCVVVLHQPIRAQIMAEWPIRCMEFFRNLPFLLISMTHLAMLDMKIEEWRHTIDFTLNFLMDINHARYKCTAAVITSGMIKNWTTHFIGIDGTCCEVSQIRLKANNLGQFRDRDDTTKKSLKGLFTFDGSMIFNHVFCGAQPRPKLNQRKFIVYFFFCNLGAWALHAVSYVTADTMQYTFSLPFL